MQRHLNRVRPNCSSESSRESGQALVIVLVAIALLAIVATVMASQYTTSVRSSYVQMDRELYHANIKSAVETFTVVYRQNLLNYSQSIRDCTEAADFTRALATGHGCPSVGAITVFSGSELSGLAPTSDFGGSFPGACQITQTGSSCTVDRPIFKFNYQLLNFTFYFNGLVSTRNMAEFVVVYTSPQTPQPLSQRFAIQGTLPLLSHLDSSNLNVVAEAPSAMGASCKFAEWEPLLAGPLCAMYGELGAGTGLALYNGQFFGLRTGDGQVIDLNTLSSSTYLVDEDGTVGGQPAFVPYCRDDLVNADDFTVIQNSTYSELYVVTGQGTSTTITLIQKNGATCDRHVICALGNQGWAQAFSGIAADPTSNVLVPPPDLAGLPSLEATFYLKSDTGKLLTTLVSSMAGNVVGDPDNTVYDASLNRTFICTSNYDNRKQVIERARTLGFERGIMQSAKYIIY